MKQLILLISIIFIIMINGCGNVSQLSGIQIQSNNSNEIKGVVNHYDVEGGFWGLTTSDGNKYLLLNNSTNYTNNSEYVISGEAHPERISFQMWGTPFEVASVTVPSK